MFRINVKVRYLGKTYTAIGYEHATKLYTLRARNGRLTYAAESALTVVAGK